MPVVSSEARRAPSAQVRPPVFVEEVNGHYPYVALSGTQPPPMVFNAAAKSAEYADRMRAHYRETRRIAVEIPCSVELVLDDGAIFDAGTGVLRNISPSGAFITQLMLPNGGLPAAEFKLRLVLNGDPYSGIGIEATPVRIMTTGGFGLGIKFDEIFVAV